MSHDLAWMVHDAGGRPRGEPRVAPGQLRTGTAHGPIDRAGDRIDRYFGRPAVRQGPPHRVLRDTQMLRHRPDRHLQPSAVRVIACSGSVWVLDPVRPRADSGQPQSRLVRRRTVAMFADVVQEVLDAPRWWARSRERRSGRMSAQGSLIAGQNSEFEIAGIQQQLDGRNLIVLGGDLAAGPEPRRGGSGSGEAHRPAVHRDGAQRRLRRRRGLLWRW